MADIIDLKATIIGDSTVLHEPTKQKIIKSFPTATKNLPYLIVSWAKQNGYEILNIHPTSSGRLLIWQ